MALTFRQVRHFIATAETGRVLAAAAGLNVTQSAVTASLKALEAEVGRKLFDRHSNGVTLTFDGQQFLQRARAIEALGRRQLRKQFCASLAQASFHTAWVKSGSGEPFAESPHYPA
jgi:DNA-binding transcriptional LysR family regulator